MWNFHLDASAALKHRKPQERPILDLIGNQPTRCSFMPRCEAVVQLHTHRSVIPMMGGGMFHNMRGVTHKIWPNSSPYSWVGMKTCNGWADSFSKPVLAFKALSMIMIVVINKLSGTLLWYFSGIRLLPVHRTSLCSIGNLCVIEELNFWWRRRVRKRLRTAWWEETWKRLCRLEKNHLKCHSICIHFTVKLWYIEFTMKPCQYLILDFITRKWFSARKDDIQSARATVRVR